LDYDYIFELDEFADYSDETIYALQKLLKRSEGKGVHEAAPLFARFHASLPPEDRLSRREQLRALNVIMDNLTPNDREKFRKIIDFLESN
jgi:DNA-directed RNA polymerase specialized sigma24 family protein